MRGRGFVMLELLVALLVLALVVTAALHLALGGYAANLEARRAGLAAGLAADLAGRVRVLPAADWTALPAPLPCVPGCSPVEVAALEYADWQAELAVALPAATALLASGPGGALVLTILWPDTGGAVHELRLGISR